MTHLANADTGATGHYICLQDSSLLTHLTPTKHGIIVELPNGSIIQATHTALLDLPSLPLAARTAHIFPDLKNGSLLSIGEMCDHGLTAQYTKHTVNIFNGSHLVLSGTRSPHSRLWLINLDKSQHPTSSPLFASPALELSNHAQLVAFYHACLCSPAVSTMLEALDKGILSLPGLTSHMVRKNKPNSIATSKGHLDQERQGQRSTQTPAEVISDESMEDLYPSDLTYTKSNTVSVYNMNMKQAITGQHYTDLTGRFPLTSKRGNQYCLIMFSHDANYIHVELLHNRSGPEFVAAYKRGIIFFRRGGFNPTFERLDNETSRVLEDYCQTQNISIQYVPPHNHRANRAERAIRTFKNHFISTLATADPSFPLKAWDELIPQAEITLNMMRSSRVNPVISAYQQLCGKYEYSSHPLAPPGMRVVAHVKPAQRESWAPHGLDGFYVGPALDHYRCYKVWVIKTETVRITDTVAWHPHNIIIPGLSPTDVLVAAIAELIQALITFQKSPPDLLKDKQPVADILSTLTDSLVSLKSIFDETKKIPAVEPQVQHQPAPVPEQRVVSLPQPPDPPEQRVEPSPAQDSAQHTLTSSPSNLSSPPGLPHPPPVHPAATIPLPVDPNPFQVVQTRSGRTTKLPSRFDDFNVHIAAGASATNTLDSDPSNYKQALNTSERAQWEKAASEEFTRLIETTKSMKFINPKLKPTGKTVSYYNPQVKKKLKNGDVVYRVRGTYGGNLLNYPYDKSANTAALSTVKLLLNAVVSEDASWMTLDIKDLYLGTPLKDTEYMHIKGSHIPADIRLQYHLENISDNDNVMVEISKGIYGLPHAGKIAQDRLFSLLEKHGFRQCANTPCLFRHITRPIVFCLVVDDFGVKYKNKEDVNYLISTLQHLYQLDISWDNTKYLGITLDFDRQQRTVSLSMPNYVQKALIRFNATDLPGANSPMIYTPPKYYSKKQQKATNDVSPPVSADRKKRIQEIVGVFLYYARAVDPTMLTAINKIASAQSNPTEDVEASVMHFLNYAHRWPNAQLVMEASDMRLAAHSDASYLSETMSRSRAGGIFFLTKNNVPNFVNGAIEQISTIIPVTVSSAAEAEYAALFLVAKEAEAMRATLEDLGYPQGPTPLICDNACAVGISNRTVKQKRTKAIDMRLHWVRDRVDQKHFFVEWQPGITNLADFFTKAHAVSHHKAIRYLYVTDPIPTVIRQCARARRIYRKIQRTTTHTP